jgi:hypothetical protein
MPVVSSDPVVVPPVGASGSLTGLEQPAINSRRQQSNIGINRYRIFIESLHLTDLRKKTLIASGLSCKDTAGK